MLADQGYDFYMRDITKAIPAVVEGYDTTALEWKHLTGTPRFDYPIEYAIAVLGVFRDEQRIDFLTTWAPNAYCHFHRHLGPTRSTVIAGRLHVDETSEHLDVHKTRKLGHAVSNPGGDVHMEYAGPDGAAVFYSMKATDGKVFDILAKDGKVIRTLSFESLATGDY